MCDGGSIAPTRCETVFLCKPARRRVWMTSHVASCARADATDLTSFAPSPSVLARRGPGFVSLDFHAAHGVAIGSLVGAYRLDALLGRGGMGSVYRATHVHLRRKVAIKFLSPQLAHDDQH